MTYEVAVVRDDAALQKVLPEWREFLDCGAEGAAFFNDPNVITYSVAHGPIRPFIVFVRRGGILQCIAPFCIEPSTFQLQFSVFRLLSLPVRLLTLFGQGFVLRKDADTDTCVTMVFDALRQAEFDVSRLVAIEQKSRLWFYCASTNARAAGLSLTKASCTDDWTFRLELPPTIAEYLAKLGAGTRSTLKRRAKKLASELSATLVKVTKAEQVRELLCNVDTIFRDSWQATTYGHMQRNSESEIDRLEYIASHNWLCCYLLTSKEGPLAFQIGYRYGDVFHASDFAFARQWSSYGSGAVLMYLMIEDLYTSGPPRMVDLMQGESPQKRTFRAEAFAVNDFFLIPHNRFRYWVAVHRGLNQVEAGIRKTLVRLRLDKAVRRFLKHKAT